MSIFIQHRENSHYQLGWPLELEARLIVLATRRYANSKKMASHLCQRLHEKNESCLTATPPPAPTTTAGPAAPRFPPITPVGSPPVAFNLRCVAVTAAAASRLGARALRVGAAGVTISVTGAFGYAMCNGTCTGATNSEKISTEKRIKKKGKRINP